jgi:hypothetical protein
MKAISKTQLSKRFALGTQSKSRTTLRERPEFVSLLDDAGANAASPLRPPTHFK